jgi:hypothetical protein
VVELQLNSVPKKPMCKSRAFNKNKNA